MATTFLGSRREVRDLSASMMKMSVEQVESRLDAFFDPVVQNLLMLRSWTQFRVVDLKRGVTAGEQVRAAIDSLDAVSSAMLADADGHEIMVMRTGNEWRLRETNALEHPGEARVRRQRDGEPMTPFERVSLEYDARTRPWFNAAIERRSEDPNAPVDSMVHWTSPYQFFTSKEPGITVSSAVESGGVVHVVALDVLLRDISAFTSSLNLTGNGQVFVMTSDGRIIGLPKDDRFGEDRQGELLSSPADLGLPHVTRAVDIVNHSEAAMGGEPFRFASEGTNWWGVLSTYAVGPGRTFWIGVLVPEDDLLGGVVEIRVAILALTAVVLAIGIYRAAVLARRMSQPIEEVVAETNRIRQGDLEPGAPIVSRMAEVQDLAEATERMRGGLQQLLKLERDLQVARDIQQATFPTTLPTITGFDIHAWSEPADETGGDTYDVVACTSADGEVQRVVMLLADATGHGIGPALSATQVRSMLRMAVRADMTVASVAHHLNEQLCDDLPESLFVTAWLGEVSVEGRVIRSISAGQGPLLLVRADGSTKDMNADGPPFGIMSDLDLGPARDMELAPDDLFLVASDGIYEAMNPAGELFGRERVKAVVRAAAGGSAESIIDALRAAVVEFCDGTPVADDQTAVLVKALD